MRGPPRRLLVLSNPQDRGSQHEWTVKQLQDAVELLEDSQLCVSPLLGASFFPSSVPGRSGQRCWSKGRREASYKFSLFLLAVAM